MFFGFRLLNIFSIYYFVAKSAKNIISNKNTYDDIYFSLQVFKMQKEKR